MGGQNLTPSPSRTSARVLRSGVAFAALVWLAPLVGGCVSAVEDNPAFVSKSTSATDTPSEAQVASENGTGAEEAPTEAKKIAETSASPAAAEVAGATSAVAAAKREAGDKDGPIATGEAAIAAFAGATVLTSSQTAQPNEPKARHQADSTLFASLYAQAPAKTPIRNVDIGRTRRVMLQREGAPVEAGAVLPGVRNNASLFEIGQRASADYDADILDEANGDDGASYQTASLTGIARLAPNGLLVQRQDVETACFQPQLVSMMRAIEARFNTKVVVTSGYRSPSHNRRVNGAKQSMHMQCKAADIIVPGADKFAVAAFARTLPGRGGVGTYCHTNAIHVDIGRQRDWNWACRRSREPEAGILFASQRGKAPATSIKR